MLQVITDAMAVTDLHQDNVMPTNDGPLIIDAEVDFFRANFSGLLSALTWPDSDDYPRTASFSIDEGQGNVIKSYDAFQNEKSIYRTQYKDGQEFMFGVLEKNKDYLLEEFDKQLQRVTKSRILPMATKDFSDYLQRSMRFNRTSQNSYVPSVVLKYEEDHKHSINELASQVVDNIKEKFEDSEEGYIFTGKAGVYFREDEFVQSIMETFENGTIIAMYIDMRGNICIDDRSVGYLYELGDKSDESTEPPRQLSREQVIKMIKDHFVDKIENYKISNGG